MNIVDEVLKDMPENLNDLEKARYVYLKLGLILNFSTKFNNTTEEMHFKMYADKSDFETLSHNQIICKAWSKIYSSILTKLGIKNQLNNLGHAFVSFEYDDKIWNADATLGLGNYYTDLSRIKNGDKTEKFGISISQDINNPKPYIVYDEELDKQLNEIDKKFNFYQLRIDQFKKISEKLSTLKDSNLSTKEKVEFIFNTLGILNDGFYESKDFVRHIVKNYINEEDINNVKGVDLKRTNKDYEVDIVQCIYVKNNDEYSYYLLSPNLPIREVNKDELIKLSILGYGLEDKNIPGVDYPKNFVKGKRMNSLLKFILIKTQLPPTLISYNKQQIGRFSNF